MVAYKPGRRKKNRETLRGIGAIKDKGRGRGEGSRRKGWGKLLHYTVPAAKTLDRNREGKGKWAMRTTRRVITLERGKQDGLEYEKCESTRSAFFCGHPLAAAKREIKKKEGVDRGQREN